MYFNENKGDTNIDNEFQKTGSIDSNKLKKLLLIVGGIVLFIIIAILLIAIIKNSGKYYIELEGESNITIYRGVTYNDPGYRAYDSRNNDLSPSVTVKSNLDSESIGTYKIVYSVKNKSITRVVNVIEKPDVITAIHLYGDKNMTIGVGSEYTEPGYMAIDAIDGDLTDSVTVNGTVDTATRGTYRITYTVVNSDGVTITEVRTVTVE